MNACVSSSQSPRFRRPLSIALMVGLVCCCASTLRAAPDQDSDEAMAEANAKLVKLLDDTNDLFYKKQVAENGSISYTVIWEADGETSKIILRLKELGHYRGKYVYGINSWTKVASFEQSAPPGVIKAVATENDRLTIGSYSCSKDFKHVYAIMNGVLENTSSGTIWMYFAYLHSNRMALQKQVNQVSEAGR